jgi:hypothetical protein
MWSLPLANHSILPFLVMYYVMVTDPPALHIQKILYINISKQLFIRLNNSC